MDTIGICTRVKSVALLARTAASELGLSISDLSGDGEVQPGLSQFRACFDITDTVYLTSKPSDDSSNGLTQEIHENLSKNESSRLTKLTSELESRANGADLWLVFAHEWPCDCDASYFEGSSDMLDQYLKLHGGAFPRLVSLPSGEFNLDLDTPIVWKIC